MDRLRVELPNKFQGALTLEESSRGASGAFKMTAKEFYSANLRDFRWLLERVVQMLGLNKTGSSKLSLGGSELIKETKNVAPSKKAAPRTSKKAAPRMSKKSAPKMSKKAPPRRFTSKKAAPLRLSSKKKPKMSKMTAAMERDAKRIKEDMARQARPALTFTQKKNVMEGLPNLKTNLEFKCTEPRVKSLLLLPRALGLAHLRRAAQCGNNEAEVLESLQQADLYLSKALSSSPSDPRLLSHVGALRARQAELETVVSFSAEKRARQASECFGKALRFCKNELVRAGLRARAGAALLALWTARARGLIAPLIRTKMYKTSQRVQKAVDAARKTSGFWLAQARQMLEKAVACAAKGSAMASGSRFALALLHILALSFRLRHGQTRNESIDGAAMAAALASVNRVADADGDKAASALAASLESVAREGPGLLNDESATRLSQLRSCTAKGAAAPTLPRICTDAMPLQCQPIKDLPSVVNAMFGAHATKARTAWRLVDLNYGNSAERISDVRYRVEIFFSGRVVAAEGASTGELNTLVSRVSVPAHASVRGSSRTWDNVRYDKTKKKFSVGYTGWGAFETPILVQFRRNGAPKPIAGSAAARAKLDSDGDPSVLSLPHFVLMKDKGVSSKSVETFLCLDEPVSADGASTITSVSSSIAPRKPQQMRRIMKARPRHMSKAAPRRPLARARMKATVMGRVSSNIDNGRRPMDDIAFAEGNEEEVAEAIDIFSTNRISKCSAPIPVQGESKNRAYFANEQEEMEEEVVFSDYLFE